MRLHASCVTYGSRAVLIRGSAGSGKSSLALELMGFGAMLVSDDRTEVALVDGWPTARAPEALRGLIEARGVGLLAAHSAPAARIVLVVDLDHTESQRLPPAREAELLGVVVPLLHKSESTHFAAAIRQYLKAGKAER